MFSHQNFNNGQADKDINDSLSFIDQWIRYYQLPVILKKSDAKNMVLSKLASKPSGKAKKIRHRQYILWGSLSIAASIAIVFFIYIYTPKRILYDATDKQEVYFLPDQSRIILDKGAKAAFIDRRKKREITLSGNAYFEVSPGKKFIVTTSSASVEVLGTRFSIYEDDQSLRVECFEGSIQLTGQQGAWVLEAGTESRLSNDKEPQFRQINHPYPQMAFFSKQYYQTPIVVAFQDVAQFFGKQIISSNIQKNVLFTGSVSNPQIDTLLSILCLPFNLQYSFTDKNEIIIQPAI